ncbi:2,3-dehydroadipyl-CoA hydratase [Variovorax boronicumulans]|uniref:enoyl-CoA hydratase/isomerase family protein n=1 Tax=Variovorax boronicumulans TaxID=436515 RepID=UPI000BB343EA|nr:enoyl-CoA hydratase/isomerase family protein [Variovorax boronicumulans]PBI87773.1 2,3-dehydroadipyl-CoA hydratase [Variovorax boronicumulans]
MQDSIEITRPAPGVGLLTISRPEKYNAIDPATDHEIARAFAELDADAGVRCIVVTGAGNKAFCAGADIPELLPHLKRNVAAGRDDPQFCGITHRATTNKPVLAAINGVALGGGLELALACDMRIASASARFGLPEIKVGVLAGGGGCTRLPRTIPAALAAEMILTGEPIDARRALEAGLISQITAPDALIPRALEMAAVVASRAPLSVRACTALLRRARYDELQDALTDERRAFAGVLLSRDADEGVRAFAEKRTPRYEDR